MSAVVYLSRFYRSDHDEGFGFRGGFGAGLIAGVIERFAVRVLGPRAGRQLLVPGV